MSDRFSPLGIIPGMKQQRDRSAGDGFALPKQPEPTPAREQPPATVRQPLMGTTGVAPSATTTASAGTMLDHYSSWIGSNQRKDALDREYVNIYA